MGKIIFRYFDEYAVHSNNDLDLIHEKFNLPKEKINKKSIKLATTLSKTINTFLGSLSIAISQVHVVKWFNEAIEGIISLEE